MRTITVTKNVFIIAELSANHNHNISIAKETICAMKESGADAVKLQTYTPDTITIDCKNDYFKINQGTLWDGRYFYDLYKEAFTPWEWHLELKELAEKLGLVFFSTPFDKTAVDFLEELNVPIYKVASFEITDIPLIEYIASKGKPIIISTGIATIEDIELAVETCKKNGCEEITLLKCTSAYPAPLEEANLLTIQDMKNRFNVEVGLSDHTLGISAPVAAVSLGAKVIEKHFILDKKLGGPDAAFSLEPEEFKAMVKAIREVEKALGTVTYELTEKQKKGREFCRSLFAVEDIKKGEVFSEKNVRSIRPGYGLHPKYYKEIIGKKANRDIPRGTPISWDIIEK
ncbi:pseudaminic acid synthase [Calditerrivibrio nitroreducens]|uniref:N-acetylneuraminate synthase n=1 Tax=Calditerrivibrio nitroreducens (strain DSM 19672 / NBRC 101217 / Yu37-1) TaxID=768670 RepID=E4TGF3_CALNY|nr:pseudaminic acid synthase [Calditerrivibrio nitroreducens]ADR18634.1 N-acetylneuraminate synthase [Calditerrivibrio nitroreducens DSM 19672]